MVPNLFIFRNIVKAKLYIDNHCTNHLTIDDICKKAHYSQFHFSRLFKELYGITPIQYLIQKKMDHAKLYLTNGKRVEEVCHLLDYNSVQTFSNKFKKMFGETPTSFQKKAVKEKQNVKLHPEEYIPGCFLNKINN